MSADVPETVPVELDLAAVEESMATFARCGGAPTLAEFSQMAEPLRAALARARAVLAAEQAVRIAVACSGAEGAATVLAEADGGVTLEEIVLARGLGKAERGRFPRGPA